MAGRAAADYLQSVRSGTPFFVGRFFRREKDGPFPNPDRAFCASGEAQISFNMLPVSRRRDYDAARRGQALFALRPPLGEVGQAGQARQGCEAAGRIRRPVRHICSGRKKPVLGFTSKTIQHEDDLMKDTGRMELLQSVRDGMQRRLAEAMIRKGLGDVLPSYGDVLCRLRLAGNPVPVSELVATLRRPKSTITKATDFLAREGLLRKRPNPGDGRSILVELTESGAAFVDAFDEARSAVGDVMFQGFSGEERRHFFDMLERMESNLYTR